MAALDEEIRPRLTDAEAKGVVEAEWSHLRGVDAIEPLPSYDDQNFLLTLRGNRRAVLKIAASGAPCRGGAGEAVTAGYLDCEHAMMRALASAGAEAPEPVPSDDGREVVPFKWTDLTCFARVWAGNHAFKMCAGARTGRGAAAAATWIVRGRAAAPPRLGDVNSPRTGRGAAAAAT